jgi:hypothetical protein
VLTQEPSGAAAPTGRRKWSIVPFIPKGHAVTHFGFLGCSHLRWRGRCRRRRGGCCCCGPRPAVLVLNILPARRGLIVAVFLAPATPAQTQMDLANVPPESAPLPERRPARHARVVAPALVDRADVPRQVAARCEAPRAYRAHMTTLAAMHGSHMPPEAARVPEARAALRARVTTLSTVYRRLVTTYIRLLRHQHAALVAHVPQPTVDRRQVLAEAAGSREGVAAVGTHVPPRAQMDRGYMLPGMASCRRHMSAVATFPRAALRVAAEVLDARVRLRPPRRHAARICCRSIRPCFGSITPARRRRDGSNARRRPAAPRRAPAARPYLQPTHRQRVRHQQLCPRRRPLPRRRSGHSPLQLALAARVQVQQGLGGARDHAEGVWERGGGRRGGGDFVPKRRSSNARPLRKADAFIPLGSMLLRPTTATMTRRPRRMLLLRAPSPCRPPKTHRRRHPGARDASPGPDGPRECASGDCPAPRRPPHTPRTRGRAGPRGPYGRAVTGGCSP